MKVTTLAKVKKGDFFYTEKEFNKHGENEKYLRIKDEYDRSEKKWYCPRWSYDAIGTGRYFKPDTKVVVEED